MVSLFGEGAEGILQTQVTAPSPISSRPGCFSHPFYRLVALGISLGCTHSSSCWVKNTPLSLIIHPYRSRQDFDLNRKAFPGIWLHITHSIKAPHHLTLSLLSKFKWHAHDEGTVGTKQPHSRTLFESINLKTGTKMGPFLGFFLGCFLVRTHLSWSLFSLKAVYAYLAQ